MNGQWKDFLSTMTPTSAGVRDSDIRADQNQTPASEAGFIDQKQLLAKLPISRGTLNNWKAKGVVPYIKIGRRCLYDWASVQGALLRRQRGGQ
jgi:hypothetical protein